LLVLMAPDTGHTHEVEDDMISKLNDDVLLSILENVNLATSMRASVLSKRWRCLPWLLTQLSIDIKDFLHEPYADPKLDDHIDKAMSSLTEAVRIMLAPTHRKSIITRLCILFFVTSGYSSKIGHLVNEAIENEIVKDVELASGLEMMPGDISDEDMVKHADSVNSFFGNYSNIYCCLTSLSLYNASFAESDLHNILANMCTQLHYLYLYHCDTGYDSLFKINAPNSKLNVLEFSYCSFDRVDLICLPKLKQLICGFWLSRYLPLTLGDVPCLKEVEIYAATTHHEPFKLSELLCGTTCIDSLTLDFYGRKIWLQPEQGQLRSAFRNLRELRLHDIFVGFGLMWTTALLEAAPSIEILKVEVYDHRCEDEEKKKQIYGERTNAPWQVSDTAHPQHPSLKELQLFGFNATEQHMAFIGAIMERASNLQIVLLKEQYCDYCNAISTTFGECGFPKNEGEQELVVDNIRNRFSFRAQIIFSGHKLCSD